MPVHTHPFHIGAIEAVVIADEVNTIEAEGFNGIFNSDAAFVIREAFQQLAAPPGFGRNILYLKTPTHRILVDTGLGHHPPQVHGEVPEGLQSLDISPEQIDLVIFTHFHLDHIWGMLNEDGTLAYPNARVVVPMNEWNHWMREDFLATQDEMRRNALRNAFTPYVESGRLEKVDDGREIVPGISYVWMPGHTPGHAGLRIVSGESQLLHIADTAHFTLQMQYLDAPPRFDFDAQQAIVTRRDVFTRLFESGGMFMAYHFPFPGLGHVIRPEGDFYWQPIDPESV
jgi:glyoxylase-like metal-dependent hydrolase (beta-lactamase superfamily II)